MSRNLDRPKILLQGKLLSVGNEPTMTGLKHSLYTIEETRTRCVPPPITQLCSFVQDEYHSPSSSGGLKYGTVTERSQKWPVLTKEGDVNRMETGIIFFSSTGTALENNPTFTMQK